MLILGAAVAAFISSAGPSEIAATPLNLFIGGSIAICAMILPGISGSFLLLLMGLYAPVLAALKGLELGTLIWFVLGAGVGILAFSRVLSWLLHQYQYAMYALLTGFMLGALVKVWPWKETISFRTNSHGEQVPFLQENILPNFSQDLMSILLASLCLVAGLAVVLVLEKVSEKE